MVLILFLFDGSIYHSNYTYMSDFLDTGCRWKKCKNCPIRSKNGYYV